MIDSLRQHESRAELSPVLEQRGLCRGKYVLLTLHRAANVDEIESFVEILEGLSDLARSHRVIFPAHPRTQKQIHELGFEPYFCRSEKERFKGTSGRLGIEMLAPQGYLDVLCLMKHARIVVTDSGGIQEETTALGVPCVTLRDNTERPVTVELGTNLLAGTRRDTIRQAIRCQLAARRSAHIPEMWDGRAGARIVGILAEHLRARRPLLPIVPAESGQIQENAR